jgi:hypothetical protein
MENIELPADISNVQANVIKHILKRCPNANMDPDVDYTVIDIVLHMENLVHLTRVIKFLNEGFEENEIISIINKSDELIDLMYELISTGVERENATAVICLPDNDLQIALSFIKDYHIDNAILSTMLYNKLENMFQRINYLMERGITSFDTAYWIVDENDDTEENITKMMVLISDGMYSMDAYKSIKN